MSRPLPESVPQLRPGCRLSDAPGQGAVLMIPEGALELAGPGPRILELCDGRRCFAELVKELQGLYPGVDASLISEEAGTFLERLRDRRILEY